MKRLTNAVVVASLMTCLVAPSGVGAVGRLGPGANPVPKASEVAASPTASVALESANPHGLQPGEVVVYERHVYDQDSAPRQLFAVGVDGTAVSLSPTPIHCCVSMSPDGTQVVFETAAPDGTRSTIGLVNTDGTGYRLLALPDATVNASPDLFLPDGRLTAVTWVYGAGGEPSQTSLVVIDPSASDPLAARKVIGSVFDSVLSVSVDGSQLLMSTPGDAAVPGQLLVVNSDGSGQHPFSPQAVNVADDPSWGPAASWSHDGSRVSFSTGPEGDKHAFIANADGTSVVPIGTTLTGAQWSPTDDLLVADDALPTGHGVLLLQPDGTAGTILAPSGGCCPIWSPDGSRVLVQIASPGQDLWISDRAGQLSRVTHENGTFDGYFDSYAWGQLP